jgi:hypothetical protein
VANGTIGKADGHSRIIRCGNGGFCTLIDAFTKHQCIRYPPRGPKCVDDGLPKQIIHADQEIKGANRLLISPQTPILVTRVTMQAHITDKVLSRAATKEPKVHDLYIQQKEITLFTRPQIL